MNETTTTPRRPVLQLVAFDCPDARALAAFYADVLGWEVEDGSDDEWVTLVPPGAPDGTSTSPPRAVGSSSTSTRPGTRSASSDECRGHRGGRPRQDLRRLHRR